MAAGVSSPPCQAYLHHPLSATSTTTPTVNTSPAFNSSSTTSSSSPASLDEPEPSPSFSSSAATTSTLSLPNSDYNGSARSRHSVSPKSSSSSPFSTPATSPIPPHSPLEPVAKTLPSSSAASASSTSLSRNKVHQQNQLGTYSARADHRTQRSGGFFAFAASAIDRTQTAIATISDPSNTPHKRSLSRLSISGDVAALSRGAEASPDKISRLRPSSVITSSPSSASALSPTTPQGPRFPSSQAPLAQEPLYSQPYSKTDASQPPPIRLPKIDNKMHQTSSRLLRMTDDDRPFTKVSHLMGL